MARAHAVAGSPVVGLIRDKPSIEPTPKENKCRVVLQNPGAFPAALLGIPSRCSSYSDHDDQKCRNLSLDDAYVVGFNWN